MRSVYRWELQHGLRFVGAGARRRAAFRHTSRLHPPTSVPGSLSSAPWPDDTQFSPALAATSASAARLSGSTSLGGHRLQNDAHRRAFKRHARAALDSILSPQRRRDGQTSARRKSHGIGINHWFHSFGAIWTGPRCVGTKDIAASVYDRAIRIERHFCNKFLDGYCILEFAFTDEKLI